MNLDLDQIGGIGTLSADLPGLLQPLAAAPPVREYTNAAKAQSKQGEKP